MEILFVYSLVVLFFLFTLFFVRGILVYHPYAEPAQAIATADNVQSASLKKMGSLDTDSKVAYGALALLLLGMCLLALLNRKQTQKTA